MDRALYLLLFPTSFFFPLLFLNTLLKMIRNEKYGGTMFFTCLFFSIIVMGFLFVIITGFWH